MKIPANHFPDRRRSLLFLLVLTLSFCSCRKYSPYSYKVTAIYLHNVDNSGNNPVDDSTGPIAAVAYAIRLQYISQLYGPNKNVDPDPINGEFALVNPVTAFNVYSRSDFDDAHPAGASLNDYFLYGPGNSQVSSTSTIANTMASGGILHTGQSFDSTGNAQPWQSNDYLVLMQPPAILGDRTFLIDIVFADNTLFTDSTFVTLR